MKYYKWMRYLISDRVRLKRVKKVISPNQTGWEGDPKATSGLEDNIHSATRKNSINQ